MRLNRISVVLGAGALGLALSAGPAFAHVTANPGEATSGGYTYHQFRVGHGCEGSPTTKVTVHIPDGVVSVKPEVEPGWKVATVKGPITPYDNHGETVTEGVKEVSFTAEAPLPDDQMTQFGISMKMPDKAGDTLWFPVVQQCQTGELRWIDIPVAGQDEPEQPAPGIKLVAAASEGEATAADAHDEAASQADPTTGEEAAAVQAGRVKDDSDTLAIVALVVGIAGLLTGGYSLKTTRRRS
jgi:Uncharacterized protein conserved in bacteria